MRRLLRRPQLSLPSPLLFVLPAFVLFTGWWVVFVHPEMGVQFAWLVCGLAGLFYFAPLGYRRGHPTEGAVAALMAVFLGPIALLVLVPWAVAGRPHRR